MLGDDVVPMSGTDIENRLDCKALNVNLFNMSIMVQISFHYLFIWHKYNETLPPMLHTTLSYTQSGNLFTS